MRFASPHKPLHLPPKEEANLPSFLLGPASSSTPDRRNDQSLLFPPSEHSEVASRSLAKALSLTDSAQLAYKVAFGLLSGKLSNFERGDVIAFYSPNQHDYVPILLGIQLAGGVVALCNPSYKSHEFAHQLRMTKARAILTAASVSVHNSAPKSSEDKQDTPFARSTEAARLASREEGQNVEALGYEPSVLVFEEGHEQSIHSLVSDVRLDEKARELVNESSRKISGDDHAVYCFSSGTSGLPKAVILTHANLVSNTIQATFLLYDRMNRAVDCGTRYSPDGKSGWYDDAEAKGAGKDLWKALQPKSANENGHGPTKGVGKLTAQLKKSLGFGKSSKAASHQQDSSSSKSSTKSTKEEQALPPSGYLSVAEEGTTGESGFSRIESRPQGEREFHIDVLPQFHCYGLLVNLVAIHTLTPRIILPRFHLETFLSSVQTHGITFGFVVPPILLALAKHPMVDKYDVSTLWRVASGAASLPDEISNAVHVRLGILCTDGYGMTEMSPIVAMQTLRDIKEGPNTVGLLAPNTEAMVIVDEADGTTRECGVNEAGELLLRGPQMMKGYLHNEEANKAAFYTTTKDDELWLRTGDVVKIDERGYVKITDRLKDVIKAKGFQVSPAELEAVFFKDARVQDVAVIGTIDAKDNSERPWAFVVSRDPLPAGVGEEAKKDEIAKSILDKVNGQVAGYKKVGGITWLDALPKSDAGKVLKKNLQVS